MEALEQLRWECRDEVYHNVSIWEPQLGRQHGTPPHGVLSALCLSNCTGLGSCHNGQSRIQAIRTLSINPDETNEFLNLFQEFVPV